MVAAGLTLCLVFIGLAFLKRKKAARLYDEIYAYPELRGNPRFIKNTLQDLCR